MPTPPSSSTQDEKWNPNYKNVSLSYENIEQQSKGEKKVYPVPEITSFKVTLQAKMNLSFVNKHLALQAVLSDQQVVQYFLLTHKNTQSAESGRDQEMHL